MAKRTVSAWEIGSRRPSFEMLDTMCELFHVRMDYLIAQSDDDSFVCAVNIKAVRK